MFLSDYTIGIFIVLVLAGNQKWKFPIPSEQWGGPMTLTINPILKLAWCFFADIFYFCYLNNAKKHHVQKSRNLIVPDQINEAWSKPRCLIIAAGNWTGWWWREAAGRSLENWGFKFIDFNKYWICTCVCYHVPTLVLCILQVKVKSALRDGIFESPAQRALNWRDDFHDASQASMWLCFLRFAGTLAGCICVLLVVSYGTWNTYGRCVMIPGPGNLHQWQRWSGSLIRSAKNQTLITLDHFFLEHTVMFSVERSLLSMTQSPSHCQRLDQRALCEYYVIILSIFLQ